MEQATISQLFIYPIKSLGGVSINASEVSPLGLKYDRNWMLIDDSGRFLSQRELPLMCLFTITLTSDGLLVKHENSQVFVPFAPTTNTRELVTIWDDTFEAIVYDEAINSWFSEQLKCLCRLVKYVPKISQRQIDLRFALQGEETAFSDGYPVLILSEASLENLNNKLEQPISIERFRPNIVIKGIGAHEEDNLQEFLINSVYCKGVKPCARCQVTTIDPTTGNSGKEPLRTLNTYRKNGNKVMFGNNVLVRSSGIVSVGDVLNSI